MGAGWLALGLVLLVLPGVVGAQSSEPSAAPGSSVVPATSSPGGSPTPAVADCTDLTALLPSELGDGLTLSAEVASGVAGFDPDDMLDPFLGSLGLGRGDLCSVGIRYGPTTTQLIGLLVRVRGAGTGLAEGLATALAGRLREYGSEVTTEMVGFATGPATRLRIVASGEVTLLVVAAATTDAALLTSSESLLEALLPLATTPSMAPASPEG